MPPEMLFSELLSQTSIVKIKRNIK